MLGGRSRTTSSSYDTVERVRFEDMSTHHSIKYVPGLGSVRVTMKRDSASPSALKRGELKF